MPPDVAPVPARHSIDPTNTGLLVAKLARGFQRRRQPRHLLLQILDLRRCQVQCATHMRVVIQPDT
jgi:hypothetical protein